MQVFLPYPDITNSLVALDRKRLRNQRGHAKLALLAVEGACPTLTNRPFARMWKGHEGFLALYGLSACRLGLLDKGIVAPTDPLLDYFREKHQQYPDTTPPPWWGTAAFHESHRSRLIQLAPGTYRRLWPDTPDNLPLLWPL